MNYEYFLYLFFAIFYKICGYNILYQVMIKEIFYGTQGKTN